MLCLTIFHSTTVDNTLIITEFSTRRQRVYGVTTAVVKVGYEYADCKDIMWDVQTTKLSGHDMGISEVGGWNLDIHHRYNFHEGKLNNFFHLWIKYLIQEFPFEKFSFLFPQVSYKKVMEPTSI